MSVVRKRFSVAVIRWIALVTLSAAAFWMANRLAAQAGNCVPHAVSHLTAVVLGALLLVGALRLYRRPILLPSGVDSVGQRVVIAGLAVFTLSQMIEALSAVIEYPDAGIVHNASGLTTALGLLILFIGVVRMVFAVAAVRILPRWALFLALLLAAFVLFAAVFGLG